ncbi:MAG: peptidoglycan DD-metalloendopeptidase family protein [Gammaproteobacteria bacterium]
MKLRRSCFFLTTALFVVIVSSWLVACSSTGKKWNPDDYTVKSGDTVYSIAWRYEIDAEDFADWNGLNSSKLIKPGQRLHTRRPYNFVSSNNIDSGKIAYAPHTTTSRKSSSSRSSGKSYSNQKWIKAKKGDSLYSISKRSGVSIERLAQLNQLKKPYVFQPGQTIFLKPLNTASASQAKPNKKAKTKSATSSKKKQPKSQPVSWPKTVRWQRPTNGKVIKKFNRKRIDAKGIDIKGKRGDAIVAAAKGKVVYSGDGLISYGNLVIIKHNKTYLSAYAYNRKLLVKEGDVVKAGQKIAEMGNKDKLSPRLHFEIRKNGKPVDPLKYLPW